MEKFKNTYAILPEIASALSRCTARLLPLQGELPHAVRLPFLTRESVQQESIYSLCVNVGAKSRRGERRAALYTAETQPSVFLRGVTPQRRLFSVSSSPGCN